MRVTVIHAMSSPPPDRNAGIEAPVPDLRDQKGRLRRLAISLAIGLVTMGIAYTITWGLAGQDALHDTTAPITSHDGGAWRFIGYFTGLGFLAGFLGSLWFLNRRASRRDSLVARAIVRK